jgi:hypothetical protein
MKPVFLNSQQVADMLNVDISVVGLWRHRGMGPAYYKLGGNDGEMQGSRGAVRYALADVEAFLAKRRIQTTETA